MKSYYFLLHASLDGNPDLCLVGSCKGKNRKVVAIVASTVSVVVFIILCALAIYHIREKKRKGIFLMHFSWCQHFFEVPVLNIFLFLKIMRKNRTAKCMFRWKFANLSLQSALSKEWILQAKSCILENRFYILMKISTLLNELCMFPLWWSLL